MSGAVDEAGPLQRAIDERGIVRLRHFTTDRGALGILATGMLKSRALLTEDQYLEHIYLPNCEVRHDPAWVGHVSLSITQINSSFFAICSGAPTWHGNMDGFWVVVELDPSLLLDEGVTFVNTNNRYSGALRGEGLDGFSGMFAPTVRPWHSAPLIVRGAHVTDDLPTDEQAEVLYPGEIASSHILRLLVREPSHADTLRSQLRLFRDINPPGIEVAMDPDAFRPVSE